MVVNYKLYKDRIPDTQYQTLLQHIVDNGIVTKTQQGEDALTVIGPPNLHYKFENGFPLITERNMAPKTMTIPIWQQAIGEIMAFINGARELEELHRFGCVAFWDSTLTKDKCSKRGLATGDNGPASYGAAFHDFPTPEGPLNQFAEILAEIEDAPHLRTHFISPWVPNGIYRRPGKRQKVVVAPCHGWIHIRILNRQLILHMFQRSADTVLGVPSNICQYAALTIALAQILGYEAFEYVHSFSDAHIYMNQMEAVKKMLDRSPRPFPTMVLDETMDDLFTVRREHFTLSDYDPWPGIKGIPLSI